MNPWDPAFQSTSGHYPDASEGVVSSEFNLLHVGDGPLYNFPSTFRNTVEITAALMQQYLLNSNEYECTVGLLHCRVGQKSYGNEKRFFCPPPSVYLKGNGWKRKELAHTEMVKNYVLTKFGPSEWEILSKKDFSVRQATVEIIGGTYCEPQILEFSRTRNFAQAKNLFVSDQDKRRYFRLNVSLRHECYNMGSFTSGRVKIISKPSKATHSGKSADSTFLYIRSGDQVALFSRTRSQNVSTKYLTTNSQGFTASSEKWSAFKICLVDPSKQDVDCFEYGNGYIHYGAFVKLVAEEDEVTLPIMRILRCDKNGGIILPNEKPEPVGQLQRVILQFRGHANERTFMATSGDNIVQHTPELNGQAGYQVNDNATWTISSVEKTEFTFSEVAGPAAYAVAPFPLLESMSENQGTLDDRCSMPSNITARGRFPPCRIDVWLGTIKCQTIFLGNEVLDVTLPSPSEVRSHMAFLHPLFCENMQLALPVLLVRDDGVVYDSQQIFTYVISKNFYDPIADHPL